VNTVLRMKADVPVTGGWCDYGFRYLPTDYRFAMFDANDIVSGSYTARRANTSDPTIILIWEVHILGGGFGKSSEFQHHHSNIILIIHK